MPVDLNCLHPITATSLLEKKLSDQPSYVAPNILPKGGTLLLGGRAKIGKSLCALEFARSLITGLPVFDCPLITVPETINCLYLESEVGEWGMQARMKLALSGLSKAETDRLAIISRIRCLRLDDDTCVKKIIQMVNETEASVLFLDPISKFSGYFNENDNTSVNMLFGVLDKIKQESKKELSMVLTHHFGKGPRVLKPDDQYNPLDPDNFRGASKWVDEVDTIICIARLTQPKVEPNGWAIRSNWTLRQGKPIFDNDPMFTIFENENGRVLYKEEQTKRTPSRLSSK